MNGLIIQNNVPLRDKNWLRTGGSARFFCEPKTAAEFQQALAYAQKNGLEIFVLGNGANILISDDGFDGLVIRPQLIALRHTQYEAQKSLVTAGAGVTIESLITYCLNHNLLGLEEFSGIPGTVGGSVFINLHYFEFFLSQFLYSATVINKTTGEITTVLPDWFSFGYNDSRLVRSSDYFLIDATFLVNNATDLETAYAQGRSTEIIRHRQKRYPYKNTCGSFFRNFYPDEVSLEINGKKMIYIAYYVDKIGIKGTLVYGGAAVSHQHANMFITNEIATSTDIINLARTIQQRVFDHFGIMPQPECRLIGFKDYPLL